MKRQTENKKVLLQLLVYMKTSRYTIILILAFFFSACENDSGILAYVGPSSEGSEVELLNNPNEFVWQGLNSWYFYQSRVPGLDENRFSNPTEFVEYLNTFQSPEEIFSAHKFSVDRFSSLLTDYRSLSGILAETAQSIGYNFGLVLLGDTSFVLGYVRYVIPGSNAEAQGLKRGDVFASVNGLRLTASNVSRLLSSNTSYEIGLGEIISSNEVKLTGETILVQQNNAVENPVFYTDIIEWQGRRVGYMVYNSFSRSFNDELNQAFGEFLLQGGVNEFVLDLRYNGGGSVETATYLGSSLANVSEGEEFARLNFNSRHQDANRSFRFSNTLATYNSGGEQTGNQPINRLLLNKLYVLVSNSSASASEMIINSLRPFIDVVVVGKITSGKNVGQIPLYDSPSTDFTQPRNLRTSYAMLPITFIYSNTLGQEVSSTGIVPDFEKNELEELFSTGMVKPLGNTDESILRTALDNISGVVSNRTFNRSKSYSILADTNDFKYAGKSLIYIPREEN